jgi:SHS2 domain-containing protein
MPYTFLDNIAIADVAFEASAATSEELFMEAADALTSVMVDDLSSVRPGLERVFRIGSGSLERLLFEYLQMFVFYKDAEGLLLRPREVSIREGDGSLSLEARVAGERIDRGRHGLGADVKAVTWHRFRVWHHAGTWKATVVLDI